MGISTTADNQGWAGFDVYDLAYERGQGKTDQQIYDQLMAEGFNSSFPSGSNKRIGPDAWSALQQGLTSNTTPTPTAPTKDPLEPHQTIYTPPASYLPDPKTDPWNPEYGVKPSYDYTNSIRAEDGGMGLNNFSEQFLADNSVYQALSPSIAPSNQVIVKKEEDPSIFEKIMSQSATNPSVSPQTFQQIIQNS